MGDQNRERRAVESKLDQRHTSSICFRTWETKEMKGCSKWKSMMKMKMKTRMKNGRKKKRKKRGEVDYLCFLGSWQSKQPGEEGARLASKRGRSSMRSLQLPLHSSIFFFVNVSTNALSISLFNHLLLLPILFTARYSGYLLGSRQVRLCQVIPTPISVSMFSRFKALI